MRVVQTVQALREALRPFNSPAFVPTMGNLHAGHLALMQQASQHGDVRVASIFVNRLQFGPNEDFDAYPRTFEPDCAALETAGCDIVFAPKEADLYPQPQTYMVHPPAALADMLEGQYRPGFFIGVSTVVMKLFQCVFQGAKASGTAFFGEKDFQQQLIIRALVQQFEMPIAIQTMATVRDTDGLALSSRNNYLSAAERKEATRLHQCLQTMASALRAAELTPQAIEEQAMRDLKHHGWRPDYMAIRRRDDLQRPDVGDRALVLLGAAKLGQTRLIDNIPIDL